VLSVLSVARLQRAPFRVIRVVRGSNEHRSVLSVLSVAIDDLRRYAVARSLFAPTTLKRAVQAMGFVQADPIRAPARAQDLTLRHRVRGYRAGDLERRYASLGIHEDAFINYGFVTSELQRLMHPRGSAAVSRWASGRRARGLMDFVRERESVHPREVDEYFSHGNVTNYWGGSSKATTHLLDALHYQGLLRVVRRENGIRIYGAHEHPAVVHTAATRRQHFDALVDVVVNLYAPLPSASLSYVISRLRYATPQWAGERTRAQRRTRERLGHAHVEGIDWFFPPEDPRSFPDPPQTVRFLAPFDPVVWDRRRFELLWGWAYRFEAYTPAPKRKFGYYALPLLWRDQVIGWGNASVKNGSLTVDLGYVASRPPSGPVYRRELGAELDRLRDFLRLDL